MELAPDFDEFIACLTAHGVEFLVVGAYALALHGAPRFTGDLDILVRPTRDNAARLIGALEAFGFSTTLTPEAVADTRRMLQMGVPPVQIHVMSAISGVEWGEAWGDRVEGPLGRTPPRGNRWRMHCWRSPPEGMILDPTLTALCQPDRCE